CRYLLGRRGLHTAVWTRLPLAGYKFSPGLRRRMRRVRRDFDVSFSDLGPTQEHEALYHAYVDHVGGDRAGSLHDVLFDDDDDDELSGLFRSRQVQIRADGRLVAYSFFDQGRDSLQSVIGVYDPAFSKYGLGIGTLLEEIQFGLDQDFRFHYAGYIVPGVSAFEYKRKVGPLQYYDPDNHQWRMLSTLDPNTLPAVRLRVGLQQVSKCLEQLGITYRLRCYPPYRVVYMNDLQDRCMSAPLFVECGRAAGDDVSLVVTFDPGTEAWTVEAYQRSRDLSELLADAPAPDDGPKADLSLLVRLDRAGVTTTASQAAAWVARARRRGPWHGVDPD
ncbi:MAG: GNAT family N-acetyltransferase, partial [Oligoflexia bacterium]|nr:GNAT family N-acetyltransferase [Oligoflexia bacterium]